LYQSTCDAGVQGACYQLGVIYDEGRGVTPDHDLALMQFDNTCEAGYAPSCTRLGEMYMSGHILDKDRRMGMQYIQRGFRDGDLEGCVRLGQMVEAGVGGDEDPVKARELYTQACEQGSGLGCHALAGLFERGVGVAADSAAALGLYRSTCDDGFGQSCGRLAEMFREGEGVIKNTREALRYLELGCQGEHGPSCGRLGEVYSQGNHGYTQSDEKATELYTRACILRDPVGCYFLGLAYEAGSAIEQNYLLAIESYEFACENGVQDACSESGPIEVRARFEVVIRDAFQSDMCEVWGHEEGVPERSRLLAAVDGAQISPNEGSYQGQVLQIRHVRNEYKDGRNFVARSFWGLDLGWEDQGVAFEHHENWRQDRDEISGFPGRESFSSDVSGSSSIIFSREEGTLRRNQSGRCEFVADYDVLTAEHCSEIQALVAGNLLSKCQ